MDADVFDRKAALERFGREWMLREAVSAFVDESPTVELRIVSALNQANLRRLALEAHCIKGSLLMLCAGEATTAAEELCLTAQRGSYASSWQAWVALDEALCRLRRILTKEIDGN